MKFRYTLKKLNDLWHKNATLKAVGDTRGAERVSELWQAMELLKAVSAQEIKAGDVVEILNLSARQIANIKGQTSNFNQDPVRDIVGQKFYVDRVTKDLEYRMTGWDYGDFSNWFQKSQLKKV